MLALADRIPPEVEDGDNYWQLAQASQGQTPKLQPNCLGHQQWLLRLATFPNIHVHPSMTRSRVLDLSNLTIVLTMHDLLIPSIPILQHHN